LADEIARLHGVRARTLIWWRSQLRKRSRDRKSKPRLLPVVVRTPNRTTPVGSEHDLEVFVEVGGARMTLRGAVTGEHLAAIVSASARGC
jgi:hypothetical protein